MSFGFSIGDFITVPTFAWQIYKSCKDSSDDFKNVSGDVASMHIVLKEAAEHLSEQTLEPGRREQLEVLAKGCYDVLKDLEALLDKYESLGTQSQRTWDRMRWGLEDISGLRERLVCSTAMFTAFNSAITSSSQARVLKKLEKLLAEVRSGRRESSLLSSHTIESLSADDKDAWRQLRKDLEDVDISTTTFLQHRRFIVSWFQSAIAAGSFEEVGSVDLAEPKVYSQPTWASDTKTLFEPQSATRSRRADTGVVEKAAKVTLIERRKVLGRALKHINTTGPENVASGAETTPLSLTDKQGSKVARVINRIALKSPTHSSKLTVRGPKSPRYMDGKSRTSPIRKDTHIVSPSQNTIQTIGGGRASALVSPPVTPKRANHARPILTPRDLDRELPQLPPTPLSASSSGLSSGSSDKHENVSHVHYIKRAHMDTYKMHEAALRSVLTLSAAEEAYLEGKREYARKVLKGGSKPSIQNFSVRRNGATIGKTFMRSPTSDETKQDDSMLSFNDPAEPAITAIPCCELQAHPTAHELEAPSPAYLPLQELSSHQPDAMITSISADDAEKCLLRIMQGLDSFEDLFSTALVDRGFYRTFKRNELYLVQNVVWNVCPAAWQFRNIIPPHAGRHNRDSAGSGPSPALYIQHYMRDSSIIATLKVMIVAHCRSPLCADTIQSLTSNVEENTARIDDAFWRIFTFCQLFGCERSQEANTSPQRIWLNRGVASAKSRGNSSNLTAEQVKDMAEIWICLGVLQHRRPLSQDVLGSLALHYALDVNHSSILHLFAQQYFDMTSGEDHVTSLNCSIKNIEDAMECVALAQETDTNNVRDSPRCEGHDNASSTLSRTSSDASPAQTSFHLPLTPFDEQPFITNQDLAWPLMK